jgi:hypothetical protein
MTRMNADEKSGNAFFQKIGNAFFQKIGNRPFHPRSSASSAFIRVQSFTPIE